LAEWNARLGRQGGGSWRRQIRGDRSRLFAEIHRVLKPGGRAVISDIVSSRDVPRELQANPDLWSGCISGAFREDRFPTAFADTGFQPVKLIERQAEAWQTIDGIEFRSVTVRATKPQSSRHQNETSVGLNVLPVTPTIAAGSCCGPTGCC
jgi:SAM-dependent methyltransferase